MTFRIAAIDDGEVETGLGKNAGGQHLGFCRLQEDGDEGTLSSPVTVVVAPRHDQQLPVNQGKLIHVACGPLRVQVSSKPGYVRVWAGLCETKQQ